MGLVCFCCPGMFRALSGMGGGGQVDPTAANNANTALYAALAVFCVVGGGLFNVAGPRLMLPAGCITYALYAWSFLYYNHTRDQTVIVVAGGILGVGGGMLWSVQGAVLTSYPPPERKGAYISMFWVIFSSGGVVGGLIPFSLNFHRAADSVNDATYIVFIVFMVAGTILSIAILPKNQLLRDDGSRCTSTAHSNPATEAVELLKLFTNWKMLLLAPAACASNFFYTYQFNNVNAAQFTTRTRGLNNVSYWGAQMVGSTAIGHVFDLDLGLKRPNNKRRHQGFLGIGTVFLVSTAIWAGGFANQLNYSFADMPQPKLDFMDSGPKFAGPFLLYFGYGLLDAIFQSMIYWVIGALADDSKVLSRYVGFYKGVQSAGASLAWWLDARRVPMMAQLVVNWALSTASFPLLVVLVALAVKDEQKGEQKEEENGKSIEEKAARVVP
ncbi:unnamed protein product [Linum tenue]|uniref:UNC93-like protein 1 n=3 Tax=Linum tenue TaxID=586396 RepID=A0AAV0IPE6_9ROSI|nr:unnamed protein product [Linum tenue]